MGVALGVHSPTSLASGEAVTPKIVAEAKIGTSKSAELGWRPAAWLCGPAGAPPPSPTPFGTRIPQDSTNEDAV